MPIEDSELDTIPDWMVAADKEAVNTLIEFWNENDETAYTQSELKEETGLETGPLIDILVEMRHGNVVEKKGTYIRPVNISRAYSNWEDKKNLL